MNYEGEQIAALEEGRRVFTVAELASLFGRHANTIRRWIRRGDLPATKLGRDYIASRRRIESIIEGDVD
jgi:excisionase family DNA binding protein